MKFSINLLLNSCSFLQNELTPKNENISAVKATPDILMQYKTDLQAISNSQETAS